ncbi:MAG: CinA family nicotinamide mononucleotide deamidase-related protein [Elusimicrobia bacterium]|nr:CinA family nicotinamide mononucleotide deamidase-related protein [Elusimicrobiota bacterium]
MKNIRCEIISVGNELLAGSPSRSSHMLMRELASIGVKVSRMTVTLDDMEELTAVMKDALSRADMIVTVGGMGSTPDDLTKQAASEALGLKLKFSRKAMENVARYFAGLGIEAPGHCDKQAEVLEGAKILENIKGSSPGQLVELEKRKIMILLPGPGEEVKYIVDRHLFGYLKDKYEKQIRKTSVIHILGMCEADVAEALKEVLETEKHLDEGEIEFIFETSPGSVDLSVICWGNNELLVDNVLHKTKSGIYAVLKDNIFGEDDDTIESVAGRLLTKKRKTLAVCESCTGGLLSSRVTDSPGSSVYFKQGMVVYSTGAKIKQLGLDAGFVKEHGAVSGEVAEEMASRMKEISGADYVLSVTGYAGPDGGKEEKAGEGYIGLAAPGGTSVSRVSFSGSRKKVKEKFAVTALEILWRTLNK